MTDALVDVFENGAIRLGDRVVCDGFAERYPLRIQTHIHDDHMEDFDKSKGQQDILMSPETYEFLIAERNAELAYRNNLHRIRRGEAYILDDGSKLLLMPSNHMLGACQVALELPSGVRIGYSGDFGWPIDDVIRVDQLVIDSTYGNPNSVRNYTQAEAESRLLEIVSSRLRYGPVHIHAFRGTIERALQIISGNVKAPIVATERRLRDIEIYQNHGLVTGKVIALDSDEGKHILGEKRYIRLYAKGDGLGNEPVTGTKIKCSAFMVGPDNPVMQFADGNYMIALTNHADFNETIKYIQTTGATIIVTDNTRTHGVDLAFAINERLSNVSASPSSNRSDFSSDI